MPYPQSYPLIYLHSDTKAKITRQCRVKFTTKYDYIGEVICEVVTFDVCQLLLGALYLWDHDVVYFKCAQKYQLCQGWEVFSSPKSRSTITRFEWDCIGEAGNQHMPKLYA